MNGGKEAHLKAFLTSAEYGVISSSDICKLPNFSIFYVSLRIVRSLCLFNSISQGVNVSEREYILHPHCRKCWWCLYAHIRLCSCDFPRPIAVEYRILRQKLKRGSIDLLKWNIPAFFNTMPCGLVCRHIVMHRNTGLFVGSFL